MEREIYAQLMEWKTSAHRKPLILYGARQVGKSYSIAHFGEAEFEDIVIVNCEKVGRIKNIFEKDFNAKRIISDIGILTGKKIVPGKTLLGNGSTILMNAIPNSSK